MVPQTVSDGPKAVKQQTQPRRIIKPAKLRDLLGGISRSTEERWRKTKPGFPRYVQGVGYSETEVTAYVDRLLSEGR